MDNYSNSQFYPFIWERVRSGFAVSWINEWEMSSQHLSLILRYSQIHAWLHQKGPQDHLPNSWGRDLLWYILKCIVCHSGIRKHSLCITTASSVPAPPFSSSATPLWEQQRPGAVAFCVAWHPGISGNPPYMQSCLLFPQAWLVKGEKKKTGMHMWQNQLSVLFHSACEGESGLLVVCLSSFLKKYLCLYNFSATWEWDRILRLNRALNRKRFP